MLKKKLYKLLKRYFLAGMIIIVPLWITIFVLQAFVGMTDQVLKILPPLVNPHTYIPIPGLGLIMVFILIILAGAFVDNYFGKKIFEWGETLVAQIPVIRTIYNSVKQLLTGILSEKNEIFKRVVIVEFLRSDIYSIGFVTGEWREKIISNNEIKFLKVFIPTTPNPTSGFFCIVSENKIKYLDISVDEAFKLIISAGFAEKSAEQPTSLT
ncbi:MAG TPA: DUF502 domain-containing protein [bacterium]